MLALALAAAQAALLLAVAVVGFVLGLSWGHIVQLTALVWVAAPVAGFLVCGALHLRASAAPRSPASASAARPAVGPCVGGRGGLAARPSRVLTDFYGAAGR